jgi:ParB-like chromosome segregation protein Spo0J
MAVSFAAEHSRTSEYRFLPEKITIKSDLNGRHDLPDIEWLKKDIQERGQVQPVTIRKDGDRAVLVAGFSRWRAVSELNKGRKEADKIQLRCTYVLCSEAEAFMANIAENRFRNSTTELDDAHNIKRLLNNYSMTEEQIAAVYFPTADTQQEQKEALKWVRGRLKLVALAPEAEKALKEGRLKLPAAKAIAKLSEEQQRAAVKGEGKVKASNIREASGKPKPPSLRDALKQVVESGKFSGIGGKQVQATDDMLEFLALLLNPAEGKKKGAAA